MTHKSIHLALFWLRICVHLAAIRGAGILDQVRHESAILFGTTEKKNGPIK